MKTMTEEKYKVGDEVFHATYGYGKVTNKESTKAWPISVEFRTVVRWFTHDGKIISIEKFPSLLTKDQAIAAGYPPPPKEKKKVKMWQALHILWGVYYIGDGLFESEAAAKFAYGKYFVRLLTEYPAVEIEVDDE